jgi:RNA polymerase sigma-70 factor (ECF subfamily)
MKIQSDFQRDPVTITIGRVKPESLSSTTRPDFEAVFQQHWPRLVALLFRLTGDRHEAEDLALEVFWRLHRTPSLRDGSQDPGGWLYRVATRLGYNALRSHKRRGHYEQAAAAQAASTSTQPPPEVQLEQRQERERVRSVLARMRPRSAQLLILRYSGFTYAEMAAATGTASGSVGTLLARAEKEFERLYRLH